MTEARMRLYVYAFVRARTVVPDGLAGLGPRPGRVRVRSRDRVGLLLSEVDSERLGQLLDADLAEHGELAVRAREHDHVVRAAAQRGPVLPFRFGTVLRDDDAADRLLADHEDAALELLAHLEGRQEWGIRVHAQRSSDDAASATDRGSGTAYLASRGAQLRAADRQHVRDRQFVESIRRELTAPAADTVDRPRREALLDIAVLLDRPAEADFLQQVQRLAARAADAGLVLTATGPWPPYSFSGLAFRDD